MSWSRFLTIAVSGVALFAAMGSAQAQVECRPNLVTFSACTVAPGVTLPGPVTTTGAGWTVNNAGTINGSVGTTGDNSGVANSGTIARDVTTQGANSPIINSGTINRTAVTRGPNSAIINSGFIGLGAPGGGVLTTGRGLDVSETQGGGSRDNADGE